MFIVTEYAALNCGITVVVIHVEFCVSRTSVRKSLQYIVTYCIIEQLKFGENLDEPSHVGQVRIQRGTVGPDPPWKITSYMGFYRE